MTAQGTSDHNSAQATNGSVDSITRAQAPKIQETVEARDALAAALTRAGIQLPAMDVRTPWMDVLEDGNDTEADADAKRAARYALVHLGVCSAPVAIALAAVIVKGAGR
ncbi:hypothetical protein [Streptomyces sp. WMMB 322]|uniref:hypothetical protein n=1 Tax=Streptomyces sp. WMMB 322 TaxID=1286821 RepID=UPI000823D795|nr:hypothetical protein [Streptomyces sp. WMMB 322]SCK48198.1 hypothetical protein H180DRAFT_04305 [Streptomyces sp. WMMB 322]